ncbi:MAG: lysophospholipid acyltransferase family protein [Desulfatitalea sp.]|nr:lysophospholipid acyltransferase family protein [Desulfatitalea sp.]
MSSFKSRVYSILTTLTGLFGPWFFGIVARGIAAGYYIGCPRRVAVSVRFYRALFPDRSRAYYLWCAWRQFQNFTSVFLDRYMMQHPRGVHFTIEGREHLVRAVAQQNGGILLMSHIGNWEVGARLLRRNVPDVRLMLYMGQRAKDQIERLQKQDLTADGIRIVAVDQDGGSPLDLLEAVAFLRSGGVVSLAGDRVWRPDQRVVPVRFLGHTVQLPEAPHMLAMASGAPLFFFFAASKGPRQYQFAVSPPVWVKAADRHRRREAIVQSAQAYADQMVHQLHRCPFEWYHFESFLGPPDGAHDPGGKVGGDPPRCRG